MPPTGGGGQDVVVFLDGAIAKVQSAMKAATDSMQFEKCIELRNNLETLEKLKEQHMAGMDVSAEIQRLRSSLG